MKTRILRVILSGLALAMSLSVHTGIADPIQTDIHLASPSVSNNNLSVPLITPPAPSINAKGYVLMDAQSGQILAQSNMDQRMEPASLTKMMTMYVVSQTLQSGRIHLDDSVTVSEKAWRTGGSRMFIKVGTQVKVNELVQGIVVDSGNDACTAMAEYIAGNESLFAVLMNQAATEIGMKNTHYVDSTGLPAPEHFSTPYDMALLARALINHFPEHYDWYKQKWFTYNGIRQPNRNRLLWRDSIFDGIKTGHTDSAGYCLVASGVRDGMRLIAVVMGAPSDTDRANDTQALLDYGFRFFETHKLFTAQQPLANPRVWLGQRKTIQMGLSRDLYVTIAKGRYNELKANLNLDSKLKAPIKAGDVYGKVTIKLNDKLLTEAPLVALQSDNQGGTWSRLTDRIALFFKS